VQVFVPETLGEWFTTSERLLEDLLTWDFLNEEAVNELRQRLHGS
jgi:hypothetical protein